MITAVVLFTRDLRVHDHPALHAACRRADRVVPVFVLDAGILSSRYATPNRVAYLLDALGDLRSELRERGSDLTVRHGPAAATVAAVCAEVSADELHLSGDVSGFARRREAEMADVARELGLRLVSHPGVTAVAPGELAPSSGDHYRVFTPYWRRWARHGFRDPLPPPASIPGRRGQRPEPGDLPVLADLVSGRPAPELRAGGELAARTAADRWFGAGIERVPTGGEDPGLDATSHLGAHLHFGALSVAELIARVDLSRPGHEHFLRQLCWRDFNHQLLAARPDLIVSDLRPRGDRWVDEADAVTAWKAGRTGYPIVDAGMRQLGREGFIHNRVRMIVASFLTKHLRIDWRVGAWHFMDHLQDGDLANNFAQWQWAAGTGTDSRPNRMLNPVVQSRRHDPRGTYIRRYVPELSALSESVIHAPWEATVAERRGVADYPGPLVDHAEARARFLADRGR